MSKIKNKIESHSKFGIKLGLENISLVLNQLDNPQSDLSIIHIAGTNGKGSVSSMISSCLQAAGYQVAKYCSPYLITFNEMFVINEQQISDSELELFYQQVVNGAKRLAIELTLYEVTTAIMFLYAKAHQVDYLVLEVGLGGRLDATNVVTPIISAITNISLDHTQILGDTIAEIAAEKAGIIKPGVPLFTTETNQEAINVFESKTNKLNLINSKLESKLNYDKFRTEVIIEGQQYEVNLFGVHQVKNFALSYHILKYLKINEEAIRTGMETIRHPARLEQISNNIIFDGAHNPASAQALVDSLIGYKGTINIIFSILKDKEIVSIVNILSQLSTNLTFIPQPELERGLSEVEFRRLNLDNVTIADTIEAGLISDQLNLVCGTFSLYSKLVNKD